MIPLSIFLLGCVAVYLGVIDAVHAAGGPYSPAMSWDGPNQLRAAKFHRIEVRQPTPDVPYPSMWMLPQPRALAILRARLEELGGRVEHDTRLESLTQDDDGVTAALAHGDGRKETVRAAYLGERRAGGARRSEPRDSSLKTALEVTGLVAGYGGASVLPMGSLFEGAMFLVFEVLVLRLRARLGETPESMRARHTNME